MAVVEFVEHAGHDVEQGTRGAGGVGLRTVAVADGLPVFGHGVEEAVVFVDQAPQALEIVAARVVVAGDVVAGGKQHKQCTMYNVQCAQAATFRTFRKPIVHSSRF